MKTPIIIIGPDSDASLSLASRALCDVYDTVETATFEDASASIAAAVERFGDGADRVIVQPYSLELSSQKTRSLEEAVAVAQQGHPDRKIRLAPQLGFDGRLVDILEDRILAAMNESSGDRNVPIITVERQGAISKEFSISDLLALPGRLTDIGELVPDRSGEAISVAALLSKAGLSGTESKATFKSGEDFSADIDLAVVRENGWLVFWLNSSPLPARYGGPVRLLIPDIDDRCANVKSVDRLIVE